MNHYSIYIIPRNGHNPYVFLDTNSQLDYKKNMDEIKHYSAQMEESDIICCKKVFVDARAFIVVCVDAIHTMPHAGFAYLSMDETKEAMALMQKLLSAPLIKN